ncbi:peptidoglycan/LPS O-acetylase OafA/YrhL [Streptomyces sp. 1114.5]|uniref:acyltransferase family protein n=1 Tax=unclassified Streptomyces TaxID=2593676 RepID=UPI000BD2DDBD|nr:MULTISPECIES: acyltransferase [unclassified Streptomyces]RKT19400.1 peptidoglycan/LPS O-acetylase OafA/YrhL [Streptomyces sp. 1114.5]SOB85596.1 Peptidoglycan/LPS O-acetylase OafA/YrhL, contains acyltransferase and SGNH-hydrolase domains [Streptomyces sp. 1331.2]
MSSPAPTRTATLPSLEGLRAIAVVFVFASHALVLGAFKDPDALSVFSTLTGDGRIGFLAVSFFFVLSGFVLTWSAKPGQTATGFWRRRVMRIGPSHVLIGAIALTQFAAAGETIRWGPAIANLFLVQNWLPSQDLIMYQFNGATWTLAVEMLCYAMFPLLVRYVRRLDTRALWSWIIGLGATAILLPAISYPLLSGFPPSHFYPLGSWPQLWALYFFPPVRCIDFVIGMFLARIVASGRWPKIRILPAVLLNLAAFLLLYHLPIPFGIAAFYPVPAALLIGSLAARDLSGKRTILSTRPMVWLGELSFAFYIIHITVMFAVHAAFKGELVGYAHSYTPTAFSTPVAVLFIIGLYVLIVALAWVLHHTVELPAMRRWSRPAPRPAANRPKPEPQPQT